MSIQVLVTFATITDLTTFLSTHNETASAVTTSAAGAAPSPSTVGVPDTATGAVGNSMFDEAPAPSVGIDTSLGKDKDGHYYDARIHVKTKTKTAKGIWKKTPRLDPEVYAACIAEQAALEGAAPTAAAPTAAAPTAAPTAAAPAPAAPAAPTAGAAPAAPKAPAIAVTYEQVTGKIIAAVENGDMDEDDYTDILVRHGVVGGWGELPSRPDTFSAIMAELNVFLQDA